MSIFGVFRIESLSVLIFLYHISVKRLLSESDIWISLKHYLPLLYRQAGLDMQKRKHSLLSTSIFVIGLFSPRPPPDF